MFVLVVIWAISPFSQYAVLYDSVVECEAAARIMRQMNMGEDGKYKPIVQAHCMPLRGRNAKGEGT